MSHEPGEDQPNDSQLRASFAKFAKEWQNTKDANSLCQPKLTLDWRVSAWNAVMSSNVFNATLSNTKQGNGLRWERSTHVLFNGSKERHLKAMLLFNKDTRMQIDCEQQAEQQQRFMRNWETSSARIRTTNSYNSYLRSGKSSPSWRFLDLPAQGIWITNQRTSLPNDSSSMNTLTTTRQLKRWHFLKRMWRTSASSGNTTSVFVPPSEESDIQANSNSIDVEEAVEMDIDRGLAHGDGYPATWKADKSATTTIATKSPSLYSLTPYQPPPSYQTKDVHQQSYTIPKDGIAPGGRLTRFIEQWKDITTHQWPLAVVYDGYQIQWQATPMSWSRPNSKRSIEEEGIVDTTINQLLDTDVVELSVGQDDRFLSRLFMIQEKSKVRPMLDCTKINTLIQLNHFKMGGLLALREMIEPGDWMATIDLKDSYTLVPVYPNSRRYLPFRHRHEIYQYKALPFGMSTAPRVFSKLMRYAIEPMRRQAMRILYFLDDIFVVAASPKRVQEHVNTLVNHHSVGFHHQLENECFDTLEEAFIHGICVRFTKKFKINVPLEKMASLRQRAREALKGTHSRRWMASLLGKITSLTPAVGDALLHCRFIQRDQARNLQRHLYQWEEPCPLPMKSQERSTMVDGEQCIHEGSTNSPTTTNTAKDNNSCGCLGFGAQGKKNFRSMHGSWEQSGWRYSYMQKGAKILTSSSIRQCHSPKVCIQTRRHSISHIAARSIEDSAHPQHISNQRQSSTHGRDQQHEGGSNESFSDTNPRENAAKRCFNMIKRHWRNVRMDIDAFAAAHNHQMRQYSSYQEGHNAEAVDVFNQKWPSKGLYLNPLWKLIPRYCANFKRIKPSQRS